MNQLKPDLITTDSKKTSEIINSILSDNNEDFLSTNCISEKPNGISRPVVSDFKSYLKDKLNLKDTVHINFQFKEYQDFKLTSTSNPNKKIITEKEFQQFEQKSGEDGIRFWDWLDTNCENGYSSISKPIFNETFDLAYVQMGIVCGFLCGGGMSVIYEFKDNEWHQKEIIEIWYQ